MDKVPAWSVVRDEAQVSGERGNMKCHLQIHSIVTHREGHSKLAKVACLVGKNYMNINCFIEFQCLFAHLLFEVGVHRSISLEIKAAAVLGQLPVSCLVAGQVLRQHLCKFPAFARI